MFSHENDRVSANVLDRDYVQCLQSFKIKTIFLIEIQNIFKIFNFFICILYQLWLIKLHKLYLKQLNKTKSFKQLIWLK